LLAILVCFTLECQIDWFDNHPHLIAPGTLDADKPLQFREKHPPPYANGDFRQRVTDGAIVAAIIAVINVIHDFPHL